jgi:uncharacterized protein
MGHAHHQIDYVEFTAPDLAVVKTFYAQAFGWEFVDYGPDYIGIVGDGKEQGGFMRGEPVTGGPLVVLYSVDLEASLRAVTAAGGVVVVPITAFPGGRRFHLSDPAGNELAVWSTT